MGDDNKENKKDSWDKFNILSGFLGSIILVAITIVIKFSADNISSSMERGKLIDSLIEELSDHEIKTRRDIALITLDAAVPVKEKCALIWFVNCKPDEEEHDLVVDIAKILIADVKNVMRPGADSTVSKEDQFSKTDTETTVAESIIRKRRPDTAKEIIETAVALATQNSTEETDKTISYDEKSANFVSAIYGKLLEPTEQKSIGSELQGVKRVYIHYRSDKQKADELKKYLESKGINIRRVEQIENIKQNDIRYANSNEKKAADRLKKNLADNKKINIDKLIDLSKSGYVVPAGQFEIWLNL